MGTDNQDVGQDTNSDLGRDGVDRTSVSADPSMSVVGICSDGDQRPGAWNDLPKNVFEGTGSVDERLDRMIEMGPDHPNFPDQNGPIGN
jgi:hypothetical protein